MPSHPYAIPLDGSERVKLARFNPADTHKKDKEEGNEELAELGREFAELGNLLSYAGQHALLVVLQGRDASGKDGSIRKILEFSNVQSVQVHPFKVPTEEERAHDFLWRVHAATPRLGHIAIFNRSHYEDVLAVRIHKLAPKPVWMARYDHINAFESLLLDSNVILLKFYLHISKDEQIERLLEREKDPLTAWKLNPNDWREVPMWDDLTQAYEDALERCASPRAPFYLVPADKKWFRNLAIMERLVLTLRPYRKVWLQTLRTIGEERLAEIRKLHAEALRGKKSRASRESRES